MNKLPLLTFNTGEVTPLLWWRSDLEKYQGMSRRLENFLVEPQGAIKRRLGTKVFQRLGEKGEFDGVRIIPWVISRDDYFQLVFIPGEIKIFNRAGIEITSLAHPYSVDDLAIMDYQQVYDIMFIANNNHPLKELRRTGQFSFQLVDHNFNGGPFGDQNVDTSDTLTATFNSGVSFTVTASGHSPFVSTDVGRQIKILNATLSEVSGNFDDTQQGDVSATLPGNGTVTLRTEGGVWEGRLDLQKSLDNGATWVNIGSISSIEGNRNGEITREVTEYNAIVRARMAERTTTTDDSGCQYYLSTTGEQYTHLEITSFSSSTNVGAMLLAGKKETITDESIWFLGSFSETTGFPGTVTIFEERLFLGGTIEKPATIYGSKINDWENFNQTTFDDGPVVFTLSSDARNSIRWMIPETQLIIGTDSGEWTVGTRENDKALSGSGSNVTARRHQQFGSEPIKPVEGGDMTIYVESGGKRMRTVSYVFQDDGYISNDMMILAEHLTKEYDLTRLAYTRTPDKIIWALREDGLLMSFTFERDQNISAWARHPMPNSKILDIDAVIGPDNDEVGLVVEREDGIYYEVINQNNLCIDWAQEYSLNSVNEIISLFGNESGFVIYDQTLDELDLEFTGTGTFIRLDSAASSLIFSYGGKTLALNEDYMDAGNLLYWFPSKNFTQSSAIKAFDGLTEITALSRIDANESFVIRVDNDSKNINNAKVKNNGVDLVRDLDFFTMTGARQFLIIDAGAYNINQITVHNNNDTAWSVDDWSIDNADNMISLVNTQTTDFIAGLPISSLIEMIDPTGGPGFTRNFTEVELYLVDSVGGSISLNGGKTTDEIKYLDSDIVPDTKPEPYTGKKVIPAMHGYTNDNNQSIIIENDSIHRMSVAAVALIGNVTGKK